MFRVSFLDANATLRFLGPNMAGSRVSASPVLLGFPLLSRVRRLNLQSLGSQYGGFGCGWQPQAYFQGLKES